MTCAVCGAVVPVGHAACPTCGAASAGSIGVAGERPPDPTALGVAAAGSRRSVPWIVLTAVMGSVAIVLLALLFLGGSATDEQTGSEAVAGQTPPLAAPPTTEPPPPTTAPPPTTPPPTTEPPPTTTAPPPTTAPPTTAPPVALPDAHYQALEEWTAGLGIDLLGECATLDWDADHGPDPWCSTLRVDRTTEVVYRVADYPGGHFAVWVLLANEGHGWEIVETADDIDGVIPF